VGGSNSAWGDLAEHDDELGEVWDGYERLPDAGVNDALDAFLESKRLDHAALVRVGARLAGPTVLAFGFPGGIKYRDMEDGRRWTSAGAEFTKLKIVRSGASRSDTVIVAEGETDGARLTMLFDCDVAVLPAGAKRFHQSFADQLQPYERVLVGLDNDEAGDVGAAKIAELVPQAVRFAPPGVNDWCALPLDAEPPELPEAATVDRAGGILFEDISTLLRQAIDGELPPPEVAVDDLLYATGVHWLSGHPGSGKSIIALAIAQMVMLEERPVVWLDYENGMNMTVRRMAEVGIAYEKATALFHYAWYPPKAETYLNDVAEKFPGALVVVDSVSKALSLAGIDENSPGEVTNWTVPLIRACKMNDLPMLVIDHVAKHSKPTDSYARGAGAKQADTDVHFKVEVLEPFNRERSGLVCLHQAKDREGYLPHRQWYRIGDGNGGLPVMPTDEPVDIDAEGEPGL
jgi:hypothetical protein